MRKISDFLTEAEFAQKVVVCLWLMAKDRFTEGIPTTFCSVTCLQNAANISKGTKVKL